MVIDCINSGSLPSSFLIFLKHIIDSSLCACNFGEVENAHHLFFI